MRGSHGDFLPNAAVGPNYLARTAAGGERGTAARADGALVGVQNRNVGNGNGRPPGIWKPGFGKCLFHKCRVSASTGRARHDGVARQAVGPLHSTVAARRPQQHGLARAGRVPLGLDGGGGEVASIRRTRRVHLRRMLPGSHKKSKKRGAGIYFVIYRGLFATLKLGSSLNKLNTNHATLSS